MAKYLNDTGLSHLMTTIKNAIAATVTGVKGNAESSYRTGQVNLTPANIGAIKVSETGNTQQLKRPLCLQGTNDVTLDAKINTQRANRLAFLPADQIIIEQTTDGGTTWTDAGVTNANKLGLFSETRAAIYLPRIDGKKNANCGLRVTFTAMKYDVPSGTPETGKYAYWNKDYVLSTERYCQLKELYFWVSVSGGAINAKVERATGKNPNSWSVAFNDQSYNMTGYSGSDFISFVQGAFGGGTTQTGQYWNYRITFMTDDVIPAAPYDGYSQSIIEIRGYGDAVWTAPNEYMANDKLYAHDQSMNAVFPASIVPKTNGVGQLGSSSKKWAGVYATNFYGALTGNVTGNVTGNCSGTASNVTGTVAIANGGTGATTAAAAWTALGGGAIGKKASLAASDIPSHASSATTYGAGSSSNYGHVKLSDSTSASTDTTGGTAATPKAVKAAYDLANGASTTAGQALSAATGALAFKVTYSISNGDVVCAAHVYSAGSEVTNDHNDSCFAWSMSLDGGATWTSLGTGKTKTVSAMSTYGGNVKCDFTPAS